MSEKMNSILESLTYVIGEDTLKKFENAPSAAGLGYTDKAVESGDEKKDKDEPKDDEPKDEPKDEKPESDEPEAAKDADKDADDKEKKDAGGLEGEDDAVSIERLITPSPNADGGSPEYYRPETGAGPVPQPLKPSKTADVKAEGISTTKTSEVPTAKAPADKDADGKPVLGKGKAAPKETSGDKEFYAPEKKLKDYPYSDPGKKPGASESKKVQDLINLANLAEDGDPSAAPAADAPTVAPAAMAGEPGAEPAPKPEWEVYATSDDLEAIAGRAREAAKVAGSPTVSLAIKFRSDEATRDQAVEALKAAGFQVLGMEQEG